MACILSPLFLISFFLLISFTSSHSTNSTKYLKSICKVTPHPALCVRTLAPFSHSVSSHKPSEWARVAVNLAITETERISNHLLSNKTQHELIYFTDCTECMHDATVQLHSSINELKDLDKDKFVLQMNDIETWVSAALTDVTTCVDGLDGFKGREVGDVKHKALKASYLCGNALALVNKLASSGDIDQ